MSNPLRLAGALTAAATILFPYWARRILTTIDTRLFERD